MEQKFMERAIRLSEQSVEAGGGPFGAVVVKDGEIIGEGYNSVTPENDPTAHAEVKAIRDACARIGDFRLNGCEIYTSCEPCPMCLSAIYWARVDKVYYGNTKEDAKEIGFDDSFIYDELKLEPGKRKIVLSNVMRAEALRAFRKWASKEDKTEY